MIIQQAAAGSTKDLLTVLVQVGSIIGGAFAVSLIIFTRLIPWFRAKLDSRSLQKQLGLAFPKQQIKNAVTNYIPPSCQDVDPAEGEEPRFVFAVRQRLFDALDAALNHPTDFRYIVLLADSGMGKTAAAINYCARHLRRLRKRFRVAIVPLGIHDADARIQAVEAKEKTVLFLDALDEDTLANVDYRDRLRILLNLTRDFYRVVLTCRTQFFSKEDEIPRRTGIFKVSARAAGEPAEYYFNKIYLSPFSDKEISKYLRRRYAPWFWRKRRQARKLVKKMPQLSVRPMLLSHIDDVLRSGKSIKFSFELYEIMIAAWIKREEGFLPDGDLLRKFSERLAIDLFVNREIRGGERASRIEVQLLAHNWEIELDGWYLTSRSLLNRDGEGNYKFAHRSVMEYLIADATFKGSEACLRLKLTDQICNFLAEMISFEIAFPKPLFAPALVSKLSRSKNASSVGQYLDRWRLERLAHTIFPSQHSIDGVVYPDSGQSVTFYKIRDGKFIFDRELFPVSDAHERGRISLLIFRTDTTVKARFAADAKELKPMLKFFHELVFLFWMGKDTDKKSHFIFDQG